MSEGTKIQWADDTHNFWRGCTKVSDGCKNCYAEKLVTTRLGGEWGKGKPRVRLKDFDAPLRWNRRPWVCDVCCEITRPDGDGAPTNDWCEQCGANTTWHRRRVFSLSLGDWLDDEVPIEWLADMLKVIHDTPNLDWLLLTKRPGNWQNRIEHAAHFLYSEWLCKWVNGVPPANIWLGVSVENQATADERIPLLLHIPAAVRFLSVEPLLGPVDLRFTIYDLRLDWVIVGGESGPGARPCNVEWIRSVVRQCAAAGVPCFVKQLGSAASMEAGVPDTSPIEMAVSDVMWTHQVRLKLKHPKGGDPSEWPETLRVREFPQVSREGAKEAK